MLVMFFVNIEIFFIYKKFDVINVVNICVVSGVNL